MQQSNLVVVANTLPVRLARQGGREQWISAPGGLASAVGPIARRDAGVWIGWTGETNCSRAPFEHEGIWNVPVQISQAEAEGSYEGVCNRTLWPLYHNAVREPEYRRTWWRRYVDVNRRFADVAADVAGPGAVVWVHDYHLQLVPALLRRRRPDVRIGFFLHIPFPPGELFIRLPWRREVLAGMLGADVVGFQTPHDARNFRRVVRRLTSARTAGNAVRLDERTVRVDAFPIAIDTEHYETAAREPRVLAKATAMHDRLGRGKTIFLGVDRLDYTKGIDVRLEAFLELLRHRPESARDCVLVQVAVPSRERIEEYRELRREIEELVGQINGQYAEVGNPVIHYLRRHLSFEELLATYRAGDVMVVTPLCDGMNLVSKEYVATRHDDSGILILSEFAGSASELRTALHVNPHDVDGIAEAMARAIALPPAEARRRMRAMRRVVKRRTVHRWAADFLEALDA